MFSILKNSLTILSHIVSLMKHTKTNTASQTPLTVQLLTKHSRHKYVRTLVILLCASISSMVQNTRAIKLMLNNVHNNDTETTDNLLEQRMNTFHV